MKRWKLDLTLQDDVVLSRRSATQGDHACLDRIPGSALRGWCAGRLYEALGDGAWDVFHSGRVRWLDALPADAQGLRSLPAPLSWHTNKGDPHAHAVRNERWQAQHIMNLAANTTLAPGLQPKGVRAGYVGAGGEALTPRTRYRLMTAVADAGQAAEGQLFGYESLAAGQRFVAYVEWDESLPPETLEALRSSLSGELRLGRSRSAQYGRVRASLSDAASGFAVEPAPVVQLLLVSDAALRDAHGHATLTPNAESLGLIGLPGLEVDSARSFVRTRRYSGWNAYRGGPEHERQVLCAGSVITLRATLFTQEALTRLSSGIGVDRAQGLGEVALNPDILVGDCPNFQAAPTQAATAAKPPMPSQSPLIAALKRRSQQGVNADTTHRVLRDALTALQNRWLQMRRYLSLPADAAWGPGASQWGALAQEGAKARTLTELREALLSPQKGLVSKRLLWIDGSKPPNTKEFWDDALPSSDGRGASLATWVLETLDTLATELPTDAARLDAWQRLCDQARRAQAHQSEEALMKNMTKIVQETR